MARISKEELDRKIEEVIVPPPPLPTLSRSRGRWWSTPSVPIPQTQEELDKRLEQENRSSKIKALDVNECMDIIDRAVHARMRKFMS